MFARTSVLCVCLGVVLAIGGMVPADEKPKYVPSGAARDAKADARPEDEVGQAYYVYADESPDHHASGWMPGGDIALVQTLESTDAPRRGKHCYKAECDLKNDPWMGVTWLLGGKWMPDKKLDLFKKIEAKKGDPVVLRFWAKSPSKAKVQFKVGGVPGDSVATAVESRWLQLGEWSRHQIDLTNQDLAASICPFLWVVNQDNTGAGKVTFYLDDVYLTKLRERPKQKE